MIPVMHFVIGLIQALGRPAFATELRKLKIIRAILAWYVSGRDGS
jgi:hypothetical protein